jgi:hypothetical protein
MTGLEERMIKKADTDKEMEEEMEEEEEKEGDEEEKEQQSHHNNNINHSEDMVGTYTLQRKSHLCIPFLGIARPQPQFPHSFVCERFI